MREKKSIWKGDEYERRAPNSNNAHNGPLNFYYRTKYPPFWIQVATVI